MNSLINFVRTAAIALILAVAASTVVPVILGVGHGVAEAATASSISVRGNQRVDSETIIAYVTIKPGQAYTAFDVDESVKILYDTGLFADVTIDQSGSVLIVTVVENPIVNSVVFEGNKKIKSDVLVTIVSIQPRGVLTDAKVQSDVARIQEYYETQGRSSADVTADIIELDNNRVDVVFRVEEGKKTGVARITFVGNDSFSSNRLKGVIQTRTTNLLSWLNRNDIYSEAKLAADEEQLRRFYMQHGFADFQVLSADAVFDPEKEKWYITFTLDEGPKYHFSEIYIDSSIPGVDTEALYRVISTKSGRVFNATLVEKSVEDLTIALARMGHVFAVVRTRGDRNYDDDTIALSYVIDEGPRVYVERIEIRGNTKTRDYVIRREFDLSEGDPYNRVLVDQAERRLRNTGFFGQVAITTEPGSAPDLVILVVFVQDQSTGSFGVAAGVTTQGLIAELSLEETNFLGRGQALRVSIGYGTNEQTYNLSFTDPYFLGYRVSAGFDLYQTSYGSSSSRPYDTSLTGGGLRLGLPITEDLSVQLNYKLKSQTISDVTSPCTGAGTESGCWFPAGTTVTSSAGYTVVYSTIDDKYNPNEGWHVKVGQDFAGIGGDTAYMRSTGEVSYYHPVFPDGDMIGLVKVQGGNILGLGMPVAASDNFFKGGETVRGFAPYGYGPRNLAAGDTAALGGKNFWAATAEVQFPFPFMPPDFGLRGALFADAGMLWGVDVPSTVTPGSFVSDTAIRSSVGGSILWSSPFGLLRLDAAYVTSKQSYDNTQVVRFGASTNF